MLYVVLAGTVIRRPAKMAEFVLHYDALMGRINVTSPGGAFKREQGT